MKIKYKSLIGFTPIIILLVILGIVSVSTMRSISFSIRKLASVSILVDQAVASLRINTEEVIRTYEEYDSNWIDQAELSDQLAKHKSHQEIYLKTLMSDGSSISTRDVDEQVAALDELYALGDKLVLQHDSSHEAKISTMKEFDGKVEDVDNGLSGLLALNAKQLTDETNRLQKRADDYTVIYLALTAVFVLLSIFITNLTSNSIVNSINHLGGAIARIAQGDFKSRSKVDSDDEISLLSKEFNAMTEKVKLSHDELEAEAKAKASELKTEKDRTSELENKIFQLEQIARS